MLNLKSRLGEIVETCGFNADNTYVFYDTFLPEGWAFEDANAEETFGVVRDEHAEPNKRYVIGLYVHKEIIYRKSVTHLSKATVEIVDDADYVEGTQYVSHFSFPLDF